MSIERSAGLPIVVMGVSGAGKSTIGRALAERLGCPFLEGDDFHPEANVRKMASGQPLTEADREPWLQRIGDAIARERAAGRPPVVACSALSRAARRFDAAEPGSAGLVLLAVAALGGRVLGVRRGRRRPKASVIDAAAAPLNARLAQRR